MPKEGKARVLTEAEFKRLLLIAKDSQMPFRNIALIYGSNVMNHPIPKIGKNVIAA